MWRPWFYISLVMSALILGALTSLYAGLDQSATPLAFFALLEAVLQLAASNRAISRSCWSLCCSTPALRLITIADLLQPSENLNFCIATTVCRGPAVPDLGARHAHLQKQSALRLCSALRQNDILATVVLALLPAFAWRHKAKTYLDGGAVPGCDANGLMKGKRGPDATQSRAQPARPPTLFHSPPSPKQRTSACPHNPSSRPRPTHARHAPALPGAPGTNAAWRDPG